MQVAAGPTPTPGDIVSDSGCRREDPASWIDHTLLRADTTGTCSGAINGGGAA